MTPNGLASVCIGAIGYGIIWYKFGWKIAVAISLIEVSMKMDMYSMVAHQ